ncbi:DASH complex subunit DAD3 family protein [Aspergillus stella-maris]|uniref:DASH complex subunit DAD3 family protein n=1 Tax=Aspergillus stella-maris TaxID=1810926 RepID=UPI003CCCCA48
MLDTTPTPSRPTTPPSESPLDLNAESLSPVQTDNAFLRPSHPLVSDLEQEVLDEYARLAGNVNKACSSPFPSISIKQQDANRPTTITLDGLRQLERKTATVCTLLKASVYSIILQQQMVNEAEAEQQAHDQMGEGTGTMDIGQGYEGDSYAEGY